MLENKYDAKISQENCLKLWKEKQIYKFNKIPNRKIYSVDTPPPTVSGTLHLGHICSYSQADMYVRYQRMLGQDVFFPLGFDNNGLPTEHLVEKELNIKAHTMPREQFTKISLDLVAKYNNEYSELMKQVGMSCDMDLLYNTIDQKSQITSQKAFLELAQKGIAYRADKPAYWCCSCRCSIANAELEDMEIPSFFNYLNFRLADGSSVLPVATTRPEFLPACGAVLVNPEDERYKHFVGKTVIVPLTNAEVPVIADNMVGLDKGTGAVMCCTFGDQTDIEWWKKYKLPLKLIINDDGKMNELAGKYAGLKIEEARNAIIEDLKTNDLIFRQDQITHNVKVHDRCHKPAEFLCKKQWFIKTISPELIDKWLELGDKVVWHPANMKTRYIAWVQNLNQDWSISRQRYFGIPFPVWYCKDCDKPHFANEKDLPVNPLSTTPSATCECGSNEWIADSDVLDTWATSSLTPQINTKWAFDAEKSKQMMPMDMRFCARDIINTWNLRTIIRAHYHQDTLPWKNLLVGGWVMADKGVKISKHLANAKMKLTDLLEKYGSDVVRYWCANGAYGRDITFSEDSFKDGLKLQNKIWNASKFVLSFMQDYTPSKPMNILPIDVYIMQKFNQALKDTMSFYDSVEMGFAKDCMEKFFWDFCDNYIEIVKNRLYKPEIYGEEAKQSGLWSCYNVLLGMLKVFAITMPFICETIYQDFFKAFEKDESIHLSELCKIALDECPNYIASGDELVGFISKVRQYKSENKLSLKTQIDRLSISTPNAEFMNQSADDIKAVCGVIDLSIVYDKTSSFEIGNPIIQE